MPAVNARGKFRAFTLVELIAAITVLSIILLLVSGMVHHVSDLWRVSEDKTRAFQEARNAFQRISTTLAQATLNPYRDYDNPTAPTRYLRRSELHFVTGSVESLVPGSTIHTGQAIFFNAPLGKADDPGMQGMETLLNGLGYFVVWDDDKASLPAFLTSGMARPRYVLKEFVRPSERLSVYDIFNGGGDPQDWFRGPLSGSGFPESVTLAQNVVLLSIDPLSSTGTAAVPLTTDYRYDSRAWWTGSGAPPAGEQPRQSHQLPPVVGVTILVLDEESARRAFSATPPELVPPDRFRNPAESPGDMETLQDSLNESKLRWRLFNGQIALKGAKWN